MPYIETNDGSRLHYRDWGTGAPVLLVHSWGLSSVMWQYQMAHLTEQGFRCVAFDRRGHGRSDPGRPAYDFDTLADDLAAVVDGLDLRDVTMVGHSIGCGEIVHYLARHGAERVKGIALVGTAVPFPAGGDPATFEATRQQWRNDLPQWLNDNADPYFGAGLPGCAVSDGVWAWTLRDFEQTDLNALIEVNRTLTDSDLRDEIAAVTVPTLIAHGTHDASMPLEVTGQVVADLLPHATLSVYENGPHGLYLTHRDRLNAELVEFAKS